MPRRLIVSIVTLLLLGACASRRAGDPSGSGPYASSILRDGDTVRATGEVVSLPGRPVRFCAPALSSGTTYNPIRYCDNGVDVIGVDLDRLSFRETKHQAVDGLAELTGVYRSGTLLVTAQGPSSPPHIAAFGFDPPCPAPAGGWPPPPPGNGGNLDDRPVEAYRQAHRGAIMTIAFARPSRHQIALYVLTSGATAPVRRALADDYPNQLCVARSVYTRAQVRTAFGALKHFGTPEAKAAGVYSVGRGLNRQGQIDVVQELRQVTPEMAAEAARFAPGLVKLRPWLAPRR